MKRPVAIILTAVLLGLLAALQLLGALGMAVAGAGTFFGYKNPQSAPPPTPFPPSFMPVLFFGMSLFCAVLAVWLILTLVGLIRLRSWARYSLLVIASCMAGFGALGALTSLAMPFMMPALPNQSDLDLSHIHIVFFIGAALYAIFSAIGVALLVYYNLAATRAVFQQFAPLDLTPSRTSTGRARPTAITVISWMYMISGPFCLLYFFLPVPAFLFGFVLSGLSAHFIYAAFGILNFAVGYGLFGLRNQARVAVYWLIALCPINIIVLLTPWGKRQFHAYMDTMNAFNTRFTPAQPTPAPNFATSPAAIIFFSLIGIAFFGVILWLLHRHREAFTPLTPPPPLPPIDPSLNQAAT